MRKILRAVAGFPAWLVAELWVARGRTHLARGEIDKAEACCRKSLSWCEGCGDAHALISRALMPGEDYLAVLSRIHACLKPAAYVEIGVRSGKSLARAADGTAAVGIDPKLLAPPGLRSRAKLYEMTSDDFFGRHDLLEELHAPRLALAFIDGLHLFEQVLKDFIHVERYSDEETVILIHDCLPVTRVAAAREPRKRMWAGDVWKIIPCLRRYRPDLSVRVIPARPSGLGVITGADPESTVLEQQFDRIVAEHHDLDLGYDCLDRVTVKNMPGILPNDPRQIEDALSK